MKRPDGRDIVDPPCWQMSSPIDFCEFLRKLPGFVPEDSILSIQGGCAADIEAYVTSRPAIYDNETDQGWFKLRTKTLYMPVTDSNLQGLADLSEKHAEPEVANSLGVYHNHQVILSWHDLPGDPIYLSDSLDGRILREACVSLGCQSLIHTATEGEQLAALRAARR